MLHYDQLIAPNRHGGVLVAPHASELAQLAQSNASLLRSAAVKIGARPLSEWRRETREKHLAGVAHDRPVIMMGHQPGLIHAGVWAKNVVAHRLAAVMSGAAVHLSVDSDAPRDLLLRIPIEQADRWTVRNLPLGHLSAGVVYEQIPALKREDLARVRLAVQDLVGSRFEQSLLPVFFEGLNESRQDWVSQVIAGRRALERMFKIALLDLRVRDVWWSPLAAHIIADARSFARHYNEAIADYRRRFGVRTANRPVPPLHTVGDHVELPFWLFDASGPRHRAFLAAEASNCVLMAGSNAILSLPRDQHALPNDVVNFVERQTGWRLRPRALITTLWSRLFLADLFIHGIGGAKYDRITDILIARYFRLPLPQVACVTATLFLDPRCDAPSTTGSMEQVLRDMTWNPQRHAGDGASRAFRELADRKLQVIANSTSIARVAPSDRVARKAAYDEIRRLNEQMAAQIKGVRKEVAHRLEQSREAIRDWRSLCDREIFLALHFRQSIELLLSALPAESDFVPT